MRFLVAAILGLHGDDGDACVIWPYSVGSHGYGQMTADGKPVCLHRIVCQIVHGDPPAAGLYAAHSCGVRACINPSHLRWATPAENSADRFLHGTDYHSLKLRRQVA